MKRTTLILAAACSMLVANITPAKAGEPVTAGISADVVSTYLWRGMKLDGAAIQPTLSLDWSGLSLSAWGSTGFTGDSRELDFTLSYSVAGLTLGLTDYWCADSETPYFLFDEYTPHVVEANIGYDFGFLSLNWYTNFLGAMGETPEGKKSYSSYFELAVPFSFGGLDWSFAAGVSPWANDFYGAESFALVNCSLTASKDVTVCDKTIPVFAQLMANPTDNRVFFAVGVSF